MSEEKAALYAEAFGLLKTAQRLLNGIGIRQNTRIAMSDPAAQCAQQMLLPVVYQDGDVWIAESSEPDCIACGSTEEEARSNYWLTAAQMLWLQRQRQSETPAQAFWRGFKRGFTKPWTIITDYWPRKARGTK